MDNQDWETHMAEIECPYLEEGQTLKNPKETLATHGFPRRKILCLSLTKCPDMHQEKPVRNEIQAMGLEEKSRRFPEMEICEI